jgi:hypothetical protein
MSRLNHWFMPYASQRVLDLRFSLLHNLNFSFKTRHKRRDYRRFKIRRRESRMGTRC